jgi:hypothetical protein
MTAESGVAEWEVHHSALGVGLVRYRVVVKVEEEVEFVGG